MPGIADILRQLQQQGGGGFADSESAYDPMSSSYNPGALGNQGFFIPSVASMGGGQSPIGGAITNNPMYTTQNPMNPGMSMGTAPGYSTAPGSGATSPIAGQDPRYFQSITAPQTNLQQQFQLSQQGIAAAIQRMKDAGLPIDQKSISALAAAIGGMRAEPIRRARQEGLQSIENITQGSGTSLGVNRDRMISSLLGSEAAATRQSTTQANVDLIGKLMGMFASMR